MFPPLASAWNPYQGVFPSYNVPMGGNFPVAQSFSLSGGYPLYTPGQRGFPYNLCFFAINPW